MLKQKFSNKKKVLFEIFIVYIILINYIFLKHRRITTISIHFLIYCRFFDNSITIPFKHL